MRAYLRSFLGIVLISLSLSSLAQEDLRFVYIQSETKSPFYVRFNNKMINSSSTGYLILPKLAEGEHKLRVGFPGDQIPEQEASITVNNKDEGLLLKQFPESGWGFQNMRNAKVSMHQQVVIETRPLRELKNDSFSMLLALVVNDSTIREIDPEELTDVATSKSQTDGKAELNKAVADSSQTNTDQQTGAETTAQKEVSTLTKDTAQAVVPKEADRTATARTRKDKRKRSTPAAEQTTTPEKPIEKPAEVQSVAVATNAPIGPDTLQLAATSAQSTTPTTQVDSAKNETDSRKSRRDRRKRKNDLAPVTTQPQQTDTSTTTEIKKDQPTSAVEVAKDAKSEANAATPKLIEDSVEVKKTTKSKKRRKASDEPAATTTSSLEQKTVDPIQTNTTAATPKLIEDSVEVKKTTKSKKRRKASDEPAATTTSPVDQKSVDPIQTNTTAESKNVEQVKQDSKPAGTTKTSGPIMVNSDCKKLATDEDYLKLRKKLAETEDADAMLQSATKAFKSRCFTTLQVKRLSVLFLTDLARYRFFEAAYPFIYDTDNMKDLESQLSDKTALEKFRALIKR